MNKINIENAQYVLGHISARNCGINATIDGIEMCVPLDPANRHYAEIMLQVEEGILTIEPAVEETNV